MPPARLELILEGAGWGRIEITSGDSQHVIPGISYLSNALDDLLRVGIDVATDRGYGLAQFFHEPGSTILVAETGWWEDGAWLRGARLSTFLGPEFGEGEPTWKMAHETPRAFVVDCGSRDELARVFLDAAISVRENHGEDGYHKLWNGQLGYPRRAVAALEAALALPSLEVEPWK
jgi:hypothetical protein